MVVLRNYRLFSPIGWDHTCSTQLFLQNKLWNKLVEIHHQVKDKYLELQNTDPDVQRVKATLSAHYAELSNAEEERANARKEFRKKSGVEIAPFDFKIRQIKNTIKEVTIESKPVFAAAKENLKEQTDALNQEFKRAVVAARQESALWWCNYNAVIQSFDAAKNRSMKTAGSELRFHSFDGQGRLTVQVQKGLTDKQTGCTVAELCSGRRNDVSLQLLSEGDFEEVLCRNKKGTWSTTLDTKAIGSRRFQRQYGLLTVTVYTSKDEDSKAARKTVQFPVILHRPLPEDARLKTLTVSKRKVGLTYEYSVSFTFTTEGGEIVHANEDTAGLNLGWKRVPGGLRIATLVNNAGFTQHYVLPVSFEETRRYLSSLQSEIDLLTNELWGKLKEFTAPSEDLLRMHVKVQRAKRPRTELCLEYLRRWRDSGLLIADDTVLTQYKALKRKFLEHRNLGDKLKRRRTDLYRNWAKQIVEKYSVITIDQLDLSKVALLEKPDGTASELTDIARYLRVVAGVSEFREWLVKQAAKVGAKVEAVSIASTITCSRCGAVAPSRPTSLHWKCGWCGSEWDQDENAGINLLMAA